MSSAHYDFIVIGSGFGGSVSALRLSEKGYRVLVVEQGRRWKPSEFAENNKDLKRWFWDPKRGSQGIFKLTFFEHVSIAHGVGVGGGSLAYACTLPTPDAPFFEAPSWGHLARWQEELAPHYATAIRMLGAKVNAFEVHADRLAREIAEECGRGEHYSLTRVGIFMGEPGKEVPDPYFGGEGPPRVGCTQCGACLTGCRVGAKNSTDKNYLYFAEKLGCTILAETQVHAVRPRPEGGYRVETASSTSEGGEAVYTADRVVFSGGVMGTVPLLLRMKEDPEGLPKLSDRVGASVRTNSEALINVVSSKRDVDYSKGLALSSIVHMDEHSHFETGRYGAGSDLFKPLTIPYVAGGNFFVRLFRLFAIILRYPRRWWGVMRANYARQTTIFIYMRALEETMRLRLGRGLFTGFRRGVVSELDPGSEGPKAQMDEADELVWKLAHKMDGLPTTLVNGLFHSAASTAHVLGGACMGDSIETGVIDDQHRVHGYEGLYVIDGAAVSANPGVNPSLTITALAERAMSFIPAKTAANEPARVPADA